MTVDDMAAQHTSCAELVVAASDPGAWCLGPADLAAIAGNPKARTRLAAEATESTLPTTSPRPPSGCTTSTSMRSPGQIL
jgi:hypothetical protein